MLPITLRPVAERTGDDFTAPPVCSAACTTPLAESTTMSPSVVPTQSRRSAPMAGELSPAASGSDHLSVAFCGPALEATPARFGQPPRIGHGASFSMPFALPQTSPSGTSASGSGTTVSPRSGASAPASTVAGGADESSLAHAERAASAVSAEIAPSAPSAATTPNAESFRGVALGRMRHAA